MSKESNTNENLNVAYITDIINKFSNTILDEEGNDSIYIQVRLGFPSEMCVPDVFHNFLITNNCGRCIFEHISYHCGIENDAVFELIGIDFKNEITSYPNLNDNLLEANYINIEDIKILERHGDFTITTGNKYSIDFDAKEVYISMIEKNA